MNIDELDFVYIIKEGEKGDELRYSLRSIAKHYPNNKVWIIGYKPYYVENVNYLFVEQTGTKWSNSVNNIIQACKCEDISEDFILMNDDFYCIDPIFPLESIIDANYGLLINTVEKYKRSKSKWAEAFGQINTLLYDIGIKGTFYDYEAHLPLRINKKKFLEVIFKKEVQDFMKTNKVLHKRTLYKNYDRPKNMFTIKIDTKVTADKDNSQELLQNYGWLSTADNIVGNNKFCNLNNILRTNFPCPCKYEIEYYSKNVSQSIRNKYKKYF